MINKVKPPYQYKEVEAEHNEEQHCPLCYSTNLGYDWDDLQNNKELYIYTYCVDCKAKFTKVYKLTFDKMINCYELTTEQINGN